MADENATTPEITDEMLLAEIGKRTGRELKSFDELTPKHEPTEEETRKANEERENQKTAWALANGKITAKQLKEYSEDTNNKTGILYSDFVAAMKEENANADEDDLKEEYNRAISKLGKSYDKAADAILKSKYPEIFKLDDEYKAYEGGLKKSAETEAKIKAESPAFISMNEEILNDFTTNGIEIELPAANENEQPIKLKYEPPKEIVEKLKTNFGSPERVKDAVLNGYDKEKQGYILKAAAINLSIQDFAKQIAEQAVLNREALLRGIPPDKRKTATSAAPVDDEVAKENNKLAKGYLKSQN